LTFSITNSAAQNNQLTGGQGGTGGGAGKWGHDHILGGAGGLGGSALGGGIYIEADNGSVNTSTLTGLSLLSDQLNGGNGGPGGAGSSAISGSGFGSFASGGSGGDAEGGSVYNTSFNPTTASTLNISGATMAGNQLTGGSGALGATGTTTNGGPGGNGGNGGNAEGGGLFEGDNTTLNVINSTIGGTSNSSTNYSNILAGGNGGGGNDGGKLQGTAANGGDGGNGGNVQGGGVFVNMGTATLVNDTIVNNEAMTVGQPGPAGSSTGGGMSGKPGLNGTASGGGYFAASGSTDNVGNTILDLNNVAAGGSGADVFGTFQDQGNNILGSTTGATGFGSGDKTGITAAQLNMGPLLNNGGPTLTEALLNNSSGKSVAIDKGNSTLVTTTYSGLFGSSPTDQRGTGFARISGSAVDVGAFEYQQPLITSLNPSSIDEQTGSFPLTITGTGFVSGATVSFGGTSLTPTSITGTQITVTVPGPIPDESAGSINVTVSTPDGSGTAGQTVTSAAVALPITDAATLTLTNPNNPINQTSNEGDSVTLAAITSSDPDTTFSATGLPLGLSIGSTTGVISGTIDKHAAGPYTVTVKGTDDGVVRGTTIFTWTVNDTTPPSFANLGTQTNDEGFTIPGPGLATNPVDADPGSIKATGLPTGLSIDSTTGVITGTIDPHAAGTSTVTISATDGTVTGTTQFTWTVNDITPPSFTNPGNQTNDEGFTIPSPGLATNPVDADLGTIKASGLPKGLSIESTTGIISGTIDSHAAGTYTVKLSATDGTLTGSTSFKWTVNETMAPSFTIGDQTNDEGFTIPSAGLATNPVDADPGSIKAIGLPKGLSIESTTGIIFGTIDSHAAGTYTVKLSATDGTLTGTTSFKWTVNDTTPPSFTNPPGTQNNKEGETVSLSITAVDADSFQAKNLPPGLTIDNSGLISGTITQPGDGKYNVTVTASDNGNPTSTSFTWNVADNLAPVLTKPQDQSSQEGDKPKLQINAVGAESFQATNLPPGLTIDNSGLISGTITQPGDAKYNVTVTAFDGTLSSQTSFTWTVAENLSPSFTTPNTQTNNEGDKVTGLATNPVDADPGSITATGLPTGLKIDSTTGVITGTIDPYADGTYTVKISATDGTLTGKTQFNWTVNDTTPPSFTIGDQTNDEGFTIPSAGLATNPVDADPGSITAIGLPKGLSIDSTTGLITGTIDPQAAGKYTVNLSATDGTLTGKTSFTWTVNDTTQPSFTNPGNLTNNEGDPIPSPGLALNPVDADPGSIKATGLPTGLSIDSTTGVISGTIDPHAAGTYTVTVSATDGTVTGKTQFTWNVNDITQPGLTNPGNQTNNEGENINLSLHPVDADPGSITATNLPPGLSIDSTTGVISGTIDPHGAGTYNVRVNAADGNLLSNAFFTWTVNDTTPPSFTNPGTQSSDGGVGVGLALNVADADAGSISAAGLPPGLSINPITGLISGTVSAPQGTYSVTVSASDGGAGSAVTFPWVVHQTPTQALITSIQNTYVGVFQVETITAFVTDPNGIAINEGVVTFQVNGETVTALVSHGFAMVIIETPLLSLDLSILISDFFQHALNVGYNDPNGIFGSSGTSAMEAPMLLDFFLFLSSEQPLQLLQTIGQA
jgi:hypothetical protein